MPELKVDSPVAIKTPKPEEPDYLSKLGTAKTSGEIADIATDIQREIGTAQQELGGKESQFFGDVFGAAKAKKKEFKEFEPTKENFKDLAGLYSILTTVAFMTGGRGRYSGMNTLSNMTGAMEGYRKGRKDIFDKELKEWEKNFQEIKAWNENINSELKNGLELYAKNPAAGIEALRQTGAKEPDGMLNTLIKQNRLMDAYKFSQDRLKQVQHAEDLVLRKREQSAKATQQQFMVQRSINALGGVSSALENIGQLPSGTTTEILPNLTTKDGMANFVRNFGGRKLSKREAQAMETLFTGVTRNLAQIEASGAATGLVGLSTQMEKLIPKAGQSVTTTALQLADIKRVAVENMKPLVESGLMPKQQADVARQLIERVERAIPYTVEDVIQAQFGGRKTLAQSGAEKATKPPEFKTDKEAQDAVNNGDIPEGVVIINGRRARVTKD